MIGTTWRAIIWLASTALLVGCGEASSTRTSATDSASTKTSSTANSALSPPTVDVVVVGREFQRCLAPAGITLHQISNAPGRVPLIHVPAEYLGAFANSNRIYGYWIATSPTNAKLVAKLLNAGLGQKYRHPAEAPSADGVVVVAASELKETEATAADNRRISAATACEKALPNPGP